MIDVEHGVITIEGKDLKICDLLKDFTGLDVELSCKVKTDEDLVIDSLNINDNE